MLVFPRWLGFEGVCLAGPVADIATAAIGVFYLRLMGVEIRSGEKEEAAAKNAVS